VAYDIYGNSLRRGHCEVHPDIAEEYPCSQCMAERYGYNHNQPQPQQPDPSIFEYCGVKLTDITNSFALLVDACHSADDNKQKEAVKSMINAMNKDFVKHIIDEMEKNGN